MFNFKYKSPFCLSSRFSYVIQDSLLYCLVFHWSLLHQDSSCFQVEWATICWGSWPWRSLLSGCSKSCNSALWPCYKGLTSPLSTKTLIAPHTSSTSGSPYNELSLLSFVTPLKWDPIFFLTKFFSSPFPGHSPLPYSSVFSCYSQRVKKHPLS